MQWKSGRFQVVRLTVKKRMQATLTASERTQRHQRAEIREYCGFQIFHAEDEPTFIAWLKERVASFSPEAEAFKIAAYSHLRMLCQEPPPASASLLESVVARRRIRGTNSLS